MVAGNDDRSGGSGAAAMTLTADDEVTLVELVVLVISVIITWAIYRHSSNESGSSREVTDERRSRVVRRKAHDDRGRTG